MKKHYDPNLKNRLSSTNNSSDIVLNNAFREWNDHISTNLDERNSTGGNDYSSGEDKRLLALCDDHRIEHQREIGAENIIMLTHPFYLSLTHMDKIESEDIGREVDIYLDTLLGFLNSKPDRSNVGIVVLETLHHYAALTSLLLEKSLIDRVIFTQYDNGYPLDIDESEEFRKNVIYFGGGYNGQCLGGSIHHMRRMMSPKNIWAISDLILNSPQHYKSSLRTSKVEGVRFSRVISLKKAIKRLGLIQ